MDNNINLSSEKLDTLTNRVAGKIEFLKQLNREDMWDKPISYCRQIEQSIMAVDTVVLEVLKEKGHFQLSSSKPLNYEMMMARIYILLYYRHRDDANYNMIVFPAIKEKMGIFRDKYLNDFHTKLNEIIKYDELISKAAQESRKNMKPKFQLTDIGKGRSDELYDEYNEEQLFRCLIPGLEYLGREYSTIIDIASVWYNAKDIVRKLWQVKYPESYIERILTDQDTQLGYVASVRPQIIMMCVYAMMRSVKKSDHFKAAITEIEDYANTSRSRNRGVLYDNMKSWKQAFDQKDLFDDYDYVGEEPKKDTFTSADVMRIHKGFEQQMESLNKQLKEKEERIKDLTKQLKKEKAKPRQEATEEELNMELMDGIENIPRLKLLWQLMKDNGAEIIRRNDQKTAMQILSTVTGIPYDSCKKLWKKEDEPITRQQKIIVELNTWMRQIGMELQL